MSGFGSVLRRGTTVQESSGPGGILSDGKGSSRRICRGEVVCLRGKHPRVPLPERRIVGNQIDLFAPSLMPFEVVNALCRASDEEGFLLESSRSLGKYGIHLQGLSGPYFDRVVRTARRNGVSVYDASYLALAENIDCRLYTADRELLKRLTDVDRKRVAHIVDFAL